MTFVRHAVATCVSLVLLLAPSWAKCPDDFVKVHGHVRCTVKSGDKVLVSLIFSEHQREGTAPEAALDVQERAFSGEVVFSTNGSNRFERCNARPKTVLVRLIGANGAEQDRTLLKISDAFKYDTEHGEYTLLTDITLSGWCDPKNEPPCPK
jgi:hypothetical protein